MTTKVVLFDALAFVIAVVSASLMTFSVALPTLATNLPDSPVPMVVGLVAGATVGNYVARRLWAATVPRPSYSRALLVFVVTLGLVALSILVGRIYWSRGFLASFSAVWLGLMVAHRFVLRRRPWLVEYVVVTAEKELVDELAEAPHADVVRIVDPSHEGELEPLNPDTQLVVDTRALLSDRVARYITSCTLAGSDVLPLARVYEWHTGRFPIVQLAEGWEMSMPVGRNAPYELAKRVVDVVLAVVLAPIALVVGGFAVVAVRLTSSGPALFRQTRIGKDGHPFTLFKVRTMSSDAEAAGAQFATSDDARVTPVGRFLRKARFDELPQIWNVLRGDLSFIGPRPEQEEFVAEFEREIPFYADRHLVRPGITGWAQVNSGYAASIEDTVEKLRFDLFYVKHMSPWLDLRIVGRTFATVITGHGAR